MIKAHVLLVANGPKKKDTVKRAFFGPIKGNGAVYFVQVSKKGNGVAKFDAATEQKNLEVSSTRFINGQTILNELFRKGNVEDNRYLFF